MGGVEELRLQKQILRDDRQEKQLRLQKQIPTG